MMSSPCRWMGPACTAKLGRMEGTEGIRKAGSSEGACFCQQ